MFEKVKNMYRLQKQAKAVKNELKNIHVESEADNLVTVTVSAEFEVMDLQYTDQAISELREGKLQKGRLEEVAKKALNKALKKAQEISTQKTKSLFQELGIGT